MTEKQRRFADAYIANGGNATQASRDAGYDVANDSTHTVIGTENLGKPSIRNYIDARLAPQREKATMTADEIVAAFVAIATGQELPNGKLPTADNMLTALDKLSRIRGMYIDKSQLELSSAMPVVISDDIQPAAPAIASNGSIDLQST